MTDGEEFTSVNIFSIYYYNKKQFNLTEVLYFLSYNSNTFFKRSIGIVSSFLSKILFANNNLPSVKFLNAVFNYVASDSNSSSFFTKILMNS